MPICKRCGNSVLHENVQKHHIIPIGIIKKMKYPFKHRVSNTIFICKDCHEIIHHKFQPEKFWWKKLEDKTLKMKGPKKFDKLINEMKEMQMEIS